LESSRVPADNLSQALSRVYSLAASKVGQEAAFEDNISLVPSDVIS